jgi:hypothetical protein
MHDPSIGRTYGRDWRIQWPRTRLGRGRLRPGPAAPGARVRARYRRELAAIERALVADTPALSAKFALFNHLTAGELPASVELVSAPARSRPRSAHLAVLLALAAVVALCLTLSAQLHPAARPCAVTATAGAASSPVRGPGCPAYANTKQ